MAPKLLEGVRVLDLSRTVAAPTGAQMLADLGADVIKVERPGGGDEARAIGPTFLRDRDGERTREGSMYLVANRNKRSITVNLAHPEGQSLIRRLVDCSDVLIENYKVGDMARYGLDYESLRKVNPGLIYCSVTGFGQDGPYAGRPGYDPIFQAMAGWMSVNGSTDGRPMIVASNPADTAGGQHVAIAVLAALHHRDRNGAEGQHIDVSLLDVAMSVYAHRALDYLLTGEQPRRRGLRGQLYPCADGQMVIGVANKSQWTRFCEVLGCEGMADDPRYDTHAARLRNAAELYPILEELTEKRTTADLSAALEEAEVPFGPVLDFPAMFGGEQVRARGMQVEVEHPLSGTMPMVANPLKFSATPIDDYRPPPLLGQHQHEILCELLGIEEAEVDRLEKAGAI